MVGSSILPVSFYKNKLYFLFGKENELADTPGWSDFGGGVEKGESIINTAMREGGEELTGFFGDEDIIKKNIRKRGGIYHINYNDQYHVHIISIPYDENLPDYYNNNHSFLWKKMNKYVLNKTKLFEKIKIKWFSVDEMSKCKSKFRKFYQDILEKILEKKPDIEKFIRLSIKKNKTIKRKNKFNKTRKSV